AARLTLRWGDANTAEERMQGNLHREIGIERLKRSGVRGVIDVIEPDALRQRRMQHGSVIGRIERAKSRSKRAHAGVAIHLQIENLDRQRVPWLRTFDEKWSSQGIVALHHAQR